MTDHENSTVAESDKKDEAAESAAAQEQVGSGELPAPEVGFDQSGDYFIVKVHIKYGFIFILGWLEKASDFLKVHVAKQMAEMQKRSIIKPPSKGLGRFNLFKGR